MSVSQAVASGSKATIFMQFIRFLVVFLSTVVLARFVDPDSFGLVAMVATLTALVEVLRDMGLSMAALRAKHLTPGQQSNLFWLNLLAGFFLGGLVLMSAPLIADFFGEHRLEGIVRWFSLIFLLNGFATQFRVRINRDLRFYVLGLADVIPYSLAFITAVYFAVQGAEYWALVIMQVATSVFSALYVAVSARWWPGLPKRSERMKELFVFSGAVALSQLVTYCMRNVDSISIGKVWGAGKLGFYDRAYQLLMMPLNYLISPLSRVAIPLIARIENREELNLFVRHLHLGLLCVSVVPYALLTGLSESVVYVLFGDRWQPVAPILAILALSGVFRAASQVAYWAFLALGRAKEFLVFQLATQLIVVIAMLSGLPFGIKGVAIGHTIGFVIYWILSLWWIDRSLDIDLRGLLVDGGKIVFFLAIPLVGFAVIPSFLMSPSLTHLLLGTVISFVGTALVVFLIPPARWMMQDLYSSAKRFNPLGKN